MTKGKVTGIIANLVLIEVDGPVFQNEVAFINHGEVKLMAEVIKIGGRIAYTQVFESTRGLKVGMTAEFSGRMIELELGPGVLSKNIDGLGNDLNKMKHLFLERGEYTSLLDQDSRWQFAPIARVGDAVAAGDWLGFVKENWLEHRIMVPLRLEGEFKVKSIIGAKEVGLTDVVAVLEDGQGGTINVTCTQRLAVKVPVTSYKEKPRPFKLLSTGARVIDTLNPIVEGGTGFIPGPFGCGKTVLQHLISQFAEADIIVVAACGERANEVVELFTEFPELDDPRTGRKLMERTIIICNTSNMPVAARESSVYTAMSISEYYRAMGYRVLLLADSTSRWAQALREMSNRLEELPGPDAFPMDLSAIIANYYSRAGYVYLNNGKTGSITFIGTVSPAGGNLKEPVTESTKKVARCFYALSQQRADSKRYPAIDPIESYSKYLEYAEVQNFLKDNYGPSWVDNVIKARDLLLRGKEAYDQINILGDDSVPLEYHQIFWKAELVDFIQLQQDGFDKVDQSTPMDRQKYMLEALLRVADTAFNFKRFEEVSEFFKKLISVYKQLNYAEFKSDKFRQIEDEIHALINSRKVQA